MLNHGLDTCSPPPDPCPVLRALLSPRPAAQADAHGPLQTLTIGDRVVLRFEGRMDTAMCEQIEAAVRAATTRPSNPIAFDLGAVDFISSAFLRLCVYAWQQAGRDGFQIVHANPGAKRVFKIAGLDRMLRPE